MTKPKIVEHFDFVAEGIRNRRGTTWIVWYDREGKLHWERLAEEESNRLLKASAEEGDRRVREAERS